MSRDLLPNLVSLREFDSLLGVRSWTKDCRFTYATASAMFGMVCIIPDLGTGTKQGQIPELCVDRCNTPTVLQRPCDAAFMQPQGLTLRRFHERKECGVLDAEGEGQGWVDEHVDARFVDDAGLKGERIRANSSAV